MPEDKKTVDIDTTGPGAEVELPEEKDKAVVTEIAPEPEKEKDEKPIEEPVKSDDAPAESDEQPDVQDSKPEKKQDEKLEEYSEGVQKRISKLTRKWREAERQKDAAVHYAQSVEEKRKAWEAKYSKLDSTYLKDS